MPFSSTNLNQKKFPTINTEDFIFKPSGSIEKIRSKLLESKNSPQISKAYLESKLTKGVGQGFTAEGLKSEEIL
jgi:hypothetical protein